MLEPISLREAEVCSYDDSIEIGLEALILAARTCLNKVVLWLLFCRLRLNGENETRGMFAEIGFIVWYNEYLSIVCQKVELSVECSNIHMLPSDFIYI